MIKRCSSCNGTKAQVGEITYGLHNIDGVPFPPELNRSVCFPCGRAHAAVMATAKADRDHGPDVCPADTGANNGYCPYHPEGVAIDAPLIINGRIVR